MRTKATVKQYTKLRQTGNGFAEGLNVRLWPNGEAATIWLKDPDRPGLGIELVLSRGPAGISIRTRALTGTPALTVGHDGSDKDAHVTQYTDTPYGQAFRAWYQGDGEHPKTLGITQT